MTTRTAEILRLLATGQMPSRIPPDCAYSEELQQLIDYLTDIRRFAGAMAAGDLSATTKQAGGLAGSLKGLHANLRHLTWQTQQVAAGDFKQQVDFLGEFSVAFNQMVEALALGRDELLAANAQLSFALEELKKTQAKLLQQEKMAAIGQLAAGIAHEINNPMGFISSNLATLEKYAHAFSKFIEFQAETLSTLADQETLARIQESRKKLKIDYMLEDVGDLLNESGQGATRVSNIVQNLRNFSQVDCFSDQRVDLNDCLISTINILEHEFGQRVVVKRKFGELPQIDCQARELNQAFLNLLNNAVEAIKGQGTIEVRSWQEGDMVCVSVGDSGRGIPEEHQQRIFEPFFTTKEVGKGTGLGLSICYEIVKKHRGTIEVESTEGAGSTFTIKLPV